MKVIFNSNLLDFQDVSLSTQNRGFRYGDGFFETIAVINGVPRFIEHHLARLIKAAKILQLDVWQTLNTKKINGEIAALINANDIGNYAKLRLTVWRDSIGLYTPESSASNYMMIIENKSYQKINAIRSAGFSKKVYNSFSSISSFKTLSAMKYVVAGIERKDNHFDEIIILDQNGFISETMSSNIFWRDDNGYYTPPISTGCIDGIMRNQIIIMLNRKGYNVEEKLINVNEFLESSHIFTTNAMGIRHLQKIENKSFKIEPVAQKIIESIN